MENDQNFGSVDTNVVDFLEYLFPLLLPNYS